VFVTYHCPHRLAVYGPVEMLALVKVVNRSGMRIRSMTIQKQLCIIGIVTLRLPASCVLGAGPRPARNPDGFPPHGSPLKEWRTAAEGERGRLYENAIIGILAILTKGSRDER
jgi:hypothetical protein